MGKRRHNPYSNSYACSRTPHKVRYQKAAFAWEVGAKQVKKTGTPLFIYRCDGCKGGWHLTSNPGPDTTAITTAANVATGEQTMGKDNVIPIGSKGVLIPCEGVVGSDRVHPELVWDPDTDLYSIIHEGAEVYSGLDPVGLREKIRTSGGGPRDLSFPAALPNGKAESK